MGWDWKKLNDTQKDMVVKSAVKKVSKAKYNERIVSAYYQQEGLPEPVYEWRFHPERMWRIDIAWPDSKVGIEVQGGIWVSGRHARGSGLVREYERHNQLLVWGWRVVYILPHDVCMQDTVLLVKALRNG